MRNIDKMSKKIKITRIAEIAFGLIIASAVLFSMAALTKRDAGSDDPEISAGTEFLSRAAENDPHAADEAIKQRKEEEERRRLEEERKRLEAMKEQERLEELKRLEAEKRAAFEERISKIESGETNIWSCFGDSVIMGDSRAVGYYYFKFLPRAQVLAAGGDTIRNIETHFSELAELKPKYLYLCYGLNDAGIGFWKDGDAYAAEVSEIAEKLHTLLPDTVIVFSSILPATEEAMQKSPSWRKIPDFCEKVKAIADECDIVYADNDAIAAAHMDTWQPDGVHVNQLFYPIWARNLVISALTAEFEKKLESGASAQPEPEPGLEPVPEPEPEPGPGEAGVYVPTEDELKRLREEQERREREQAERADYLAGLEESERAGLAALSAKLAKLAEEDPERWAQTKDRFDGLTGGGANVWEMFGDSVIMGDSRACGFFVFGFLPKSRVLAAGGDTIRNIRDHLSELAAIGPKNVFLCYGLNDAGIGFWKDGEEYAAELAAIVSELEAVLPEANIVFSSVLPATEEAMLKSPSWRRIELFNAEVKAKSAEMGIIFSDNTLDAARHMDWWQPDGVHINQLFYPLWASNMLISVIEEETK